MKLRETAFSPTRTKSSRSHPPWTKEFPFSIHLPSSFLCLPCSASTPLLFIRETPQPVRTPLIVSATAEWSAAHLHRNRSSWEWRRFCFNGDPIHQCFEPSHPLHFPRSLKIRITLDTIILFLDVPRPKPRHVTCMVVRSPWLNCIQSSPLCSVCGAEALYLSGVRPVTHWPLPSSTIPWRQMQMPVVGSPLTHSLSVAISPCPPRWPAFFQLN